MKTFHLGLAAVLVAPLLISSPAQAASGITVSPVKISTGCSNYYLARGMCPRNGAASIDITDSTSFDGATYRAILTDQATGAARSVDVDESYDATFEDVLYFDKTLDDGKTYAVEVVQSNAAGQEVERSAVSVITVTWVKSPGPTPSHLRGPWVRYRGKWAMLAGKKYSTNFSGPWESGATFTRAVWITNVKKGDTRAARLDKGVTSPDFAFTVPRTQVGKEIGVAVHGYVPGKVTSSISWNNRMTIVRPQPKSYVKSHGKKSGPAKVGRKVKVSAPTFSSAGKKAKVTARYQWLRSGEAIKGARKPSRRLTAADRGQVVSLRVTYVTRDFRADRVKVISFGVVR